MFQQYRPERFTKAVLNLLIINGILFLATMVIGSKYGISLERLFALYFPLTPEFKWYQLITHMFMHGSVMHILLNMYALWLFGTKLESLWGTQRFLAFYFICGVGAFLTHWLVGYLGFSDLSPIIGASGAVSGLVVAYGYLFRDSQFMIIPIPIPIKAKYLVLILAAFDLLFGIIGNDGIAHFAHLGGMVTGLILIVYWNKTNRNTLY